MTTYKLKDSSGITLPNSEGGLRWTGGDTPEFYSTAWQPISFIEESGFEFDEVYDAINGGTFTGTLPPSSTDYSLRIKSNWSGRIFSGTTGGTYYVWIDEGVTWTVPTSHTITAGTQTSPIRVIIRGQGTLNVTPFDMFLLADKGDFYLDIEGISITGNGELMTGTQLTSRRTVVKVRNCSFPSANGMAVELPTAGSFMKNCYIDDLNLFKVNLTKAGNLNNVFVDDSTSGNLNIAILRQGSSNQTLEFQDNEQGVAILSNIAMDYGFATNILAASSVSGNPDADRSHVVFDNIRNVGGGTFNIDSNFIAMINDCDIPEANVEIQNQRLEQIGINQPPTNQGGDVMIVNSTLNSVTLRPTGAGTTNNVRPQPMIYGSTLKTTAPTDMFRTFGLQFYDNIFTGDIDITEVLTSVTDGAILMYNTVGSEVAGTDSLDLNSSNSVVLYNEMSGDIFSVETDVVIAGNRAGAPATTNSIDASAGANNVVVGNIVDNAIVNAASGITANNKTV